MRPNAMMKAKPIPALASSILKKFFSTSRTELLARGLPKKKPIQGVKQTLMIASGKGGVGKSTVAVNLAVALKKLEPDKEVALLDADVFGPSIPLMMNLHDTPLLTDDNYLKPLVNYDVKCMSIGNLITKTSATIWRGLMVMNALDKLMREVAWDPVDYMIIDTPPGTGDTHLSLIQNIPITGAVIVSTGQQVALEVAARGITMFRKLKVPVVGMIHNMSSIQCPNCHHDTSIFGENAAHFSQENNIRILANISLNRTVTHCCDNGQPVVLSHPDSQQAQAFCGAASIIADYLKSQITEE